AYSWYQHIRSHGDPVAKNYSFHTVISANDSAPKPLRDLRNRCLNPGKYSHYLERWLAEYSTHQLHIIDGSVLRAEPAQVMNTLQKFLKLTPHLDYNKLLNHYLERWLAEYSTHQLHIIDGSVLRAEPAQVMNTLQKFLKLTPHLDYNKLLNHYLERWLAEYSTHQLHIIDGSVLRAEPAQVMNTLQKFLKLTPHLDYNKLLNHYLERWLAEYSTHQLHIIVGSVLRAEPAQVMNALQKFLKLTPHLDYNKLLKTKCLGKSKGRVYPPMEERSAKFLKRYYTAHNTALSKLLVRLGRPVPQWLKDELSSNG
ncbi:putative heparan sulfate n-deacetylase/n-sulfotransferase, partial [Operophtera brumata]